MGSRVSGPYMDSPPPPPPRPPSPPRHPPHPQGERHVGGEMLYQDTDHRLRALVGSAEGFGRHAIVAPRRRARESEGGVPGGGAPVDRLRGVRHHPPPLLPPRLLVQDHRRARPARGAHRQGAPAQVMPSRHHLQPGVRRRPWARRGWHPGQARLHQHLDRPLHPRRLR
ncbi:Pectin lyase-like superfamily protein [Zea mays]|uniref:Pectin lyase-like superfamily protein n=1 Tax=Zea mays TaxID=4577 RepID=A0A1D6H1C6_MAIZE|nr:Pectin lyase-like superfamily protein [Zea mays]